MEIKSNVIPNAIWIIHREIFYLDKDKKHRALKHNEDIVKQENEFIKNYNPIIFFNDLTGVEWCFDKKMPSGGWLENITTETRADGIRIFKALILC